MRTLVTAFVLAVLAIVVVFVVLSLIGVDSSVAGAIATTIIGGVPYIRESLDKYLATRTHPQGVPLVSLGRFALTPQRLILYGVLMLFSAMQLASAYGGIIASSFDLTSGGVLNAIRFTSILVVFPVTFLIGRWVGRRSESKGLLVILLIALIARVGASILDFVLTSPEELVSLLSGLGEGSPLLLLVVQNIIGIPLFFAIGALGYWRGRHQRLGSYVGYLLRNVPESTRHAIVDLAFEEAKRTSSAETIVQPSSSSVGSGGLLVTPRSA